MDIIELLLSNVETPAIVLIVVYLHLDHIRAHRAERAAWNEERRQFIADLFEMMREDDPVPPSLQNGTR